MQRVSALVLLLATACGSSAAETRPSAESDPLQSRSDVELVPCEPAAPETITLFLGVDGDEFTIADTTGFRAMAADVPALEGHLRAYRQASPDVSRLEIFEQQATDAQLATMTRSSRAVGFEDLCAAGDPMESLEALMGNQRGEEFGFAGLGSTGSEDRASGTGEGYGSGVTSFRGRVEPVARVRSTRPSVEGALSAAVVHRVVRRHINEIRSCYESALADAPDLAGQVEVRWVVGSDGAVSDASIAESTFGDAEVEGCFLETVRGWSFPRPENGRALVEVGFSLSTVR